MASEQIGNVYPTQIPGYDDSADIQAALKLYHYGDLEYDTANQNANTAPANSIAGFLYNLQDQIDTLELHPPAAADISITEPVDPVDGYLWLNASASSGPSPLSATSIYQSTTPTENLVDGLLWVKKGTDPLEMSVYDANTSAFLRII